MERHGTQDPAQGRVRDTPTASEARQHPGTSALTTAREEDNAQPAGLVGEAADGDRNNDPLVVDDADQHDDEDSTLGESVDGSSSTSLASSVLHFKYENGRRYHSFREGKYPLPNDEQEQDRLDLHHHLFRLMVGGALYRAPIPQGAQSPKRILDVGTGTGIWAIDIADEFPNALVIGTDLSPIQPGWTPPNCKFYIDDVEAQWDFSADERFDFIHARSLCGSIADWPKFYQQVLQSLNPGGWIEVQEYEAWLASDDETMDQATWSKDWIHTMDFASRKFGKRLNIAPDHYQWMKDAGFVDVKDDIIKVPIGTWAKDPALKETGRFERVHMLETVEPHTMALYSRVMGYSQQQIQVIVEGVKGEMRDPKLHLYATYHFVYGRKPGHDQR